MANVIQAILEINPNVEVSVSNENIDTIVWHVGDPIAKADIQAKMAEIDTRDSHIVPRQNSYPSVSEQLDKLYHDMTAGKLDTTGEWHKAIKAIKDANPKN